MTDELIVKLFAEKNIGKVAAPIVSVSGGFMHRMYRVETDNGIYAVKHLNSDIMKRPDAMKNFKRAEALEKQLEDAGIPIVPALTIDGNKMQLIDGEYFYIFHWQSGTISDWYNISAEQCRIAGNIQGKIHAIDPKQVPQTEPEISSVNWDGLIEEAALKDQKVKKLLEENKELLVNAENEMNKARAALPSIECIVDEDMDPKNVMWDNSRAVVIDLECLDRGNPVSSVLQLSLQWAGITICDLDLSKMKAFFEGYTEAYDIGFKEYDKVFGLAYTWIEWLEYNITRALDEDADKAEREMGLSQAEQTIARIRYINDMEERIVLKLKVP
ncbi:MAG: phosphotransferase [Lachnospiraceae bacterium]|nr:phosphotransferase [Lachnospiraceae bacterium]